LWQTQFNRSNNKFTYKQQKYLTAISKSGALRIFWLAFKLLGYKLRSVFDVDTSSLSHLRNGPLLHRLKGDLGVLALEACKHILYHFFH
jgi:hypothetical protein